MRASEAFTFSVLGGLVGLGLWLILMSLTHRQVFGDRVHAERTAAASITDWPIRLAIGALGGAAVVLVTKWPVAGIITAVGISVFWGRLGSTKDAMRAADKGEAIAAWTEQVYGSVQTGHGTNAAILAAAKYSPPVIREDARRLARDLETMTTPDAIRKFAAELDDPTGDAICAAIALSVASGSDITDVLKVQADSARDQVKQLREITASRSEVRSSTRAVIAITLAMILGVKVMAAEFLSFYDGARGQLSLLVIGGMFLMSFYLLTNLMKPKTSARYFSQEATS